MASIFKSLRFQISITLAAVVALVFISKTFTTLALQEQRESTLILAMVSKLKLSAQQLLSQAVQYKENPARDYDTYYRDVELYYNDLKAHLQNFTHIENSFVQGKFTSTFGNINEPVTISMDPLTIEATANVLRVWSEFKAGLLEALGQELSGPRLEYAATYIFQHHAELEEAVNELETAYRQTILERQATINLVNQMLFAFSVLVTAVLLTWFYRQILRPLHIARNGFERVAQGDFGFQVKIRQDNELQSLARSFNHLSARLNAIFQLLEQLQKGHDLQQIINFVNKTFHDLIPLDWIGVLILNPSATQLRLDVFSDSRPGKPLAVSQIDLDSKICELIRSGAPCHLRAATTPNSYPGLTSFLEFVNLKDAILLPLPQETGFDGIMVFATETPARYEQEHLELLNNIGHLLTYSFSRTASLIENERLAAIGEFASGIAHEIRTPLGTIGLALDYVGKQNLTENSQKRVELASAEAQRVARLLEDMLLYAKPMQLKLSPVNLGQLIERAAAINQSLIIAKGQTWSLSAPPGIPTLAADDDRLTQVFLNLIKNAVEASPENGLISCDIKFDAEEQYLTIRLRNDGVVIAKEIQQQLFQPFFTTKAAGTGLGLAIVKRICEAHHGNIAVSSAPEYGTCFTVTLPLITQFK